MGVFNILPRGILFHIFISLLSCELGSNIKSHVLIQGKCKMYIASIVMSIKDLIARLRCNYFAITPDFQIDMNPSLFYCYNKMKLLINTEIRK